MVFTTLSLILVAPIVTARARKAMETFSLTQHAETKTTIMYLMIGNLPLVLLIVLISPVKTQTHSLLAPGLEWHNVIEI